MSARLMNAFLTCLLCCGAQAAPARFSGDLAAGEQRRLTLAAGAGDYLEGRLQTAPAGVRLDLLDARGQPVRRLLQPGDGQQTFRFVADTGMALQVSASVPTSYALDITRQVPPAAQQLPVAALESPTLQALAGHLARGGDSEAFWARIAREGAPLIEPAGGGQYRVSFLWRGARRGVKLFGGPARDHLDLARLGQSDVWYLTLTVPADTRASYQLAPDVPVFEGSARERRVVILATAQADPFNPRSWPDDAPDRFNRHSVLELPAAPPQPGLAEGEPPRGALSLWQQRSNLLGNSREIALYRPAGFQPQDPDNLLLFVFDGPAYRGKVPTPAMLDRLIAEGRLPPVVAVFVANPDADARARELPDNPVFARFMASELLPRVLAETGLAPQPTRTLLAGSSYGGLAAASVALRYPQHFGNVLSLSGSFWWSPPGTEPARQEYLAGLIARQARLPLRFSLSAGLFETAQGGTPGILETTRHLRDLLEARDYPVHYREYAGGHDYLVWRGALADGLLALFGRPHSP